MTEQRSDQHNRSESHGEPTDPDRRGRGTTESVQQAVRRAGEARNLDAGTNPLYATALALGAKLDDPFTSEAAMTGLSSEIRQLVKLLDLNAPAKTQQGEKADVLTLLQNKAKGA